MSTKPPLCVLATALVLSPLAAAGGQDVQRSMTGLKMMIVQIADHWVGTWSDSEWDASKGIFKFRHGPYSDAFEHHYVAAVLLGTPESRYHRNETLRKRVVSDLLYHGRVFVEQCRDKGLRGYWKLNAASDRGIPIGSGSWQSRAYIRACHLLDGQMTARQKRAWREGARWLIAALTVDWKETYGPWWSTNKVADHVAGVAQWLHVSRDTAAREFLDRQYDWFWRAFPEEGCADKYHNYFAKTLYRLAPVLLLPEARKYHQPLLKRIRMWRSFITPNGFYDAALHGQPNNDETWKGKLGPVLSLLLAAAPHDPELAMVALNIARKRLGDHQTEAFWKRKFSPYFGQHWGSLGLIIETAPQWQKAAEAAKPPAFEQMRFFDYWPGLGRVAVKTGKYQASCYMHWAWTWDFAVLGGTLYRLNTPGEFHFPDRIWAGRDRFTVIPRTETARCWLDWDPHKDPETGGPMRGAVVARTGDSVLSLPPSFPDQAVVTGLPEGRLYGLTSCRYTLGDVLRVRTTNVFLNDAVVVLNTITALKNGTFDSLYVQQSLSNPGELAAVTADGRTIEFAPDNARPARSVSYTVAGPFELRGKGGKGALGFAPLANSFTKQELVDISLYGDLRKDQKRTPHRAEQWRGHLPTSVRKGQVLVADFVYVPRGGKAPFAPGFEAVRSDRAHGVAVPGEPAVVIGQSIHAEGAAEFVVRGMECTGQLFAAELAGGDVRKACLYGRSLVRGDQAVVRASREASLTVLTQRADGIADAGVGPLEIALGGKTRHLFSTNHEFPRMACVSQRLGAAGAERPPEEVPGVESACRRFALLPQRIEIAAHLAELELLQRSAKARGAKAGGVAGWIGRANQALNAGDLEQARYLAAEAEKEILALHGEADRAQKPVAPVMERDAAGALLPPAVAGQERAPKNYLVSFAEEGAHRAVKQRAEALCRAATGRDDGEKLCAAVRATEHALLTRYFGLPIRWTREHIPGQPDFFWRPILLGAGNMAGGEKRDKMSAEPLTDREKALAKYVAPGDLIWLALRRIRAAEALVQESRKP